MFYMIVANDWHIDVVAPGGLEWDISRYGRGSQELDVKDVEHDILLELAHIIGKGFVLVYYDSSFVTSMCNWNQTL